MADQIITFNYAKANYDAYKKQTIPATNECMTKADVAAYINADMSLLSAYANNQLVPRVKVVGVSLGFSTSFALTDYEYNSAYAFTLTLMINYTKGQGKIYPGNSVITPTTYVGSSYYNVNSISSQQTIMGDGFIQVAVSVNNWLSGNLDIPIKLYGDQANTISSTLILKVRKQSN